MTRAGLVKRLSALVALLGLSGAAGFIAVQSDDDPSADAGLALLAEIDDVVFYQVVTGDTWQNIAARYNLAGQTLAIQNNQATTTPQPRVGRILLIIPGPPPSSTTLPPSSTSSSTTSSPTSTTAASTTTTVASTTTTTQPPAGARFETLPVGATLPTEANCASRVRSMSENRPENATYNATRGTNPHNSRPRVTGNFVGTTDEILQWVACKWGIDEDRVRAQVVQESFWKQSTLGDFTTNPPDCIPGFPIGNYPPQYNGDSQHNGQCPESIGLMQDRWAYHMEAFEDSNAVRSSAYNVDYGFAVWRACFEGEFTWLNTVEHGATYGPGDLLGCQGVWFAGRYRTPAALTYMEFVDDHFTQKTWLGAGFPPAVPDGGGPPTTTTVPGSTTSTSSSTTTTTTQPPVGGQFVETFENEAALDTRFRQQVHYRNIAIGFPGGHGGSFQADHDHSCSPPNIYRTIASSGADPAGTDEVIYWCPNSTGHFMTAVGDIDGYSVVTVSPNQTFPSVRRVCWDVNVTNMGNRQWTEVAVVPASATVGGNITFVTSDFASVDDSVPVYPAGSIVVANAGYALTFYNGATNLGGPSEPSDPEGFASKAIRRQKCLTDNPNGTITYTQFTGTSTFSYSFNGNFPTNAAVIFGDHDYTPDKAEIDFPRPGYVWHWDNVIVE